MEAFMIGAPMEAYVTGAAHDMFSDLRRCPYTSDRWSYAQDKHRTTSHDELTSTKQQHAHKPKTLLKWLCSRAWGFQSTKPSKDVEPADVTVTVSLKSSSVAAAAGGKQQDIASHADMELLSRGAMHVYLR